ncbi:hypothetical protein J5N97_027112 [Dioscorea zingiberensis]|uniref:Uncharacterized protein n=1 Tax=Dioscorea zingiberensis TaxID=325984 RepID=A0A9D5H7B5_9LILI|nr:hypothetical protein J5N97_027112 [Dioscorea zingiberensis]
MGETPSEAVVSAGPAVFISSSAPNSLMVQAFPPHPSTNSGRINIGAASSGNVHENGQPIGSSLLPRNVDIRVHTGHTVPVASANSGEQVSAQNAQEQMDVARNSGPTNTIRQVLVGASTNESPGESRVRLVPVPVRTMVALPAGVIHSTSAASGSGVGVLYPLLASVQQMNSGINDARGSQASTGHHTVGPETARQITFQSTAQRQNLDSNSASAVRNDNHVSPNTAPAAFGVNPTNGSSQNQGSTRIYISSQPGIGSNNNISSGAPVSQDSQGNRFNRFDQVIRSVLRQEIDVGGIGHQSSGISSAAEQVGATGDVEMQSSAALSTDDQATYVSNLLQNIIPHLPQITGNQAGSFPTTSSSTAQNERGTCTNSKHSQSGDPPSDPNSKRQKRD